jgi:hypothetical protein
MQFRPKAPQCVNRKQKIVLWAGIGAFCLTLFCAPWRITPTAYQQTDLLSGAHYSVPRSVYSVNAPVWDAPIGGELVVGTLLVEWIGICVVSALLMMALRGSQSQPTGR